jgi:flagellar motility protein MotE (MotC chaperone)
LPLKAAAAIIAVLSSHFEPSLAQSGQPKPKWGTKLETEAEFAYRSVYERYLANYHRSQAARSRVRQDLPATATAGVADTPDLPSRKAGDQQAENGAAEQIEAEIAGGSNLRDERPADSLSHSLIGRPRNLGDVITTQVAGSDGEQTDPESGLAPRNRGDQYCTNIATAAADARFLWHQQKLLETEEQVKNRIADLEAKIAEYRKWLDRRDEFSRKAQGSVTNIYAKMRPDAAAQQLMALDEEMAAAVIIKLNPRVASAVMAEMDAQKAARLSAIISGAAKGPKGKPAAQSQGRGT